MALDIKGCLEAIAPNDIISQKAFSDILDIIIEFLNTYSKPSIDVENTFVGENEVIDEELVKIYLNDIYTILKKMYMDPNITGALDAFAENYPTAKYVSLLTETTNSIISTENGYNILFYSDESIDDSMNGSTATGIDAIGNERLKEYLYSAKAFKQRKGSVEALEYAYNIIRLSGIQKAGTTDAVMDTLFSVEYGTEENPQEPFMFRITGSLIPALYENAVVPIAHPLGFGYEYYRLMKLAFLELGLVQENQSNYDVKVVCDNGREVYPVDSNTILNITKEYDDFGDFRATVFLNNNTKIVRDYNSTVFLMDMLDNILIDYPDSCALYMDYDIRYESAINVTEQVLIDYDLGIDVLPEIGETLFEMETWCVGETYYLTTENDEPIITERLDYNLITCLAE